jgi:hypothetical protein
VSVGSLTQKRRDGDSRSLGSVLRAAGRVALWVLVGVLLVRGLAGVLTEPQEGEASAASHRDTANPATTAFAVRFARTYLADASPEALASFLAPGIAAPPLPGDGAAAQVEQAEVASIRDFGGGQAVVTVACELADARTLYLAVPIVREDAAEVAALGVPAVVAGPAGVGAAVEPPRPVAGPDAEALIELVRRFLPVYLSAASADDLSYLLAPGAAVTPPGAGLELVAVTSVKQDGSGEGPRRTVIAAARARDTATGAILPVSYRLRVAAERGRWYVERVEGALS